jgi:hypothetical protein
VRHLVLGSFTAAGRSGGLVFIVAPDFAAAYGAILDGHLELVTTIPGRIAKLVFPGTLGLMPLEITNLHFEVELQPGAPGFHGSRLGFVQSLFRSLAPRHDIHSIVAGDWNSTPSDEPRFNPIEGTFADDRSTVAKKVEEGMGPYTELYQPHFTRRGMSGGVIVKLSRIDRIYSNAATCELLDRRPRGCYHRPHYDDHEPE